jgi:putative inorganic carbon (HCO3(-)) transporter
MAAAVTPSGDRTHPEPSSYAAAPMVDRAGAAGATAAIAPAVLLAVDPWGWYPFGPLRWLVVSVAVPAAAVLVLGRRPLPAAARPALAAGGALVAVMAVAAAVGRDPLYAWTGTPERHAGVALWLLAVVALAVGAGLDPRRAVTVVGRGLVVTGLGVGAVGWAEALGWEPDELAVGTRLTGTLGSSAFLGAVCALLLPAVGGIALDRAERRGWRRAAGVAVVALAVPVVGAGARSAWLGLVAAGVAVLVARRRELAAVVGARRRAAGLVAVALVVATGAVLGLTPAGARLLALGDADAPGGQGRVDEWRVATRVLADHPVLGVGPEGYRIAFAEGVDERYEIAHGRDPQPDRAHSAPLDVALAGGAPALLAWGAWVALVGRACGRALRRGSPATAGLAAALVAHLVGQLTLFPLAEVEPVAWLLAGVLLAADPSRTGDQISRPEGRSDRHYGVGRVVLAGAAVVALVAGVRDVAADHRAAGAARALADGDGPAAARAAEDAVALRPDVVRLRLLAARADEAAGEGIVAALDQVEAARRTSPGDPIVERERIRLLVARAAAPEIPAHARRARRAADAAVADDPADGALWLLAGEAARLDGDPVRARTAWERAERLDPRSPAAAVDLALLHHDAGRDAEARAALDRARAIDPDDPAVREAARLVAG